MGIGKFTEVGQSRRVMSIQVGIAARFRYTIFAPKSLVLSVSWPTEGPGVYAVDCVEFVISKNRTDGEGVRL